MAVTIRTAPTSADFGPTYYHEGGTNYYGDYRWRRGRLRWLFPYLWQFRSIARRHKKPIHHLEVGCAFGYFLAHAAAYVQHSMGVDLSPYAITHARENFPHLTFAEARATTLPCTDGAFDILTSIHTVEHIPDFEAALREFQRVLAAHGTLFIVVPYHGLYRQLMGWNDRDPTHVSVLSFPDWCAALSRNGFRIQRSFTYPTLWGGHAGFIAQKTSYIR